jgi:hypothetical protein
MAVQQLCRADAVFPDQLAQPCQQDFQSSGFWRLRREQSVLHGLRAGRLGH